jgi:hypothetical protein
MEERIKMLEGKVEYLAAKLGRMNADLTILAAFPDSEMADQIRKRFNIVYQTEKRLYEESKANDNNTPTATSDEGVLSEPPTDSIKILPAQD